MAPLALFVALLALSSTAFARSGTKASGKKNSKITNVLLISVDGMHYVDLANYVMLNPRSNLALLQAHGATFTEMFTTKPSDSYPGLNAIVTGATPRTMGVYYDVSYDRSLYPAGSMCKGPAGTEVAFDESIDYNLTQLFSGGIDSTKLPLQLKGKTCTPVYPHNHIRVNNIFEVAKKHKLGVTAWTDKHPAYEILNGPSGKGVDDLYAPEIAAVAGAFADIAAYDDYHRKAILNWINGLDSTGKKAQATPVIFGGNFQTLSTSQKRALTGGYLDSYGTFSKDVQLALNYIDAVFGDMIAALKTRNLYNTTLIILTAKHGQSPIDPRLRFINSVDFNFSDIGYPNEPRYVIADDVAMVFLNNQTAARDITNKLMTPAQIAKYNTSQMIVGANLEALFGSPLTDPVIPDFVLLPANGVIFAGPKATKVEEHGGFNEDDVHVVGLVSNPTLFPKPIVIHKPTFTTGWAPYILKQLGIHTTELQGIVLEGETVLPGI
jgi:hypothetical protein